MSKTEPKRAYVFPPSREMGIRPLILTVGLPSPAPSSFSRCGKTWNITTCVYTREVRSPEGADHVRVPRLPSSRPLFLRRSQNGGKTHPAPQPPKYWVGSRCVLRIGAHEKCRSISFRQEATKQVLTSPKTTVVVISPFLLTMSCACRICERLQRYTSDKILERTIPSTESMINRRKNHTHIGRQVMTQANPTKA